MQLREKKKGKVCATLGVMAATLFAATSAHAVDVSYGPGQDNASGGNYMGDQPANAAGTTHMDSSILFYHEAGGRVKAIEPTANLTLNSDQGSVLSVGIVGDILTGASPSGAAPLGRAQTFIAPSRATTVGGTEVATTGSSGQIVPVLIGGVTTYTRQYVVPANTLPTDHFMDHRAALNLSYSTPIGKTTTWNVGAGFSKESDYTSLTAHIGLSQDLNQKNTTLSATFNYETDRSSPYYGTPIPFSVMDGSYGPGGTKHKHITGFVLGVTQVMTRHWLAQLSYSYASNKGYQNDPYRIISVIDGSTAVDPAVTYRYENRPDSRTRQSIYLGNKIAIGHAVTDLSGRYYHDSWGIKSETVRVSERVPLSSELYVEPSFRWYKQTAANFYHPYLLMGAALPAYASSDYRLGKFTATTIGLQVGYKMWDTGELYFRAESYKQHGDAHPAGVIAALAQQDLFAGVKVFDAMVGLSFDF